MKNLISLLSFSLIINISAFSQKVWNQKTDITGVTRNSCIAFSINGKGYLGLGQNSSSTKIYDFYEYDPSSNTWTQKANYPGGGSFASSAFVINGKGYVCLGANNAGTPQKDLWEYTPSTNSWAAKATFPGAARYGASWFVINDTAFVITGSPGGTPYLSDVWMYVPATNAWTQKAGFTGGARAHGAGFTVDGVGYFGTGINSSATPTKDVWKYNKAKDTWSRITDVSIGAITGAIAFEIDKKGYLGTGYDLTNYFKDIYQYDASANTWTKLDSIPSSISVRGGSVSFLINKTIYIGTGYSVGGASLKDLWSFTPKSSCSAALSTEPYSQSVNQYDTAKFSALSNDTGTSYKWQINTGSAFTDISNGGQYSGAKTKKLAISNVKYSTNNGHKFRCIAIGKSCSDTSITATLSVTCTAIFKNDATNQTGTVGGNIKFIVTALYSNTTFLWQKDDGTGFKNLTNSGQYNGFGNDTLVMSDLLYSNNNYKFRCLATFDGCSSTSSIAALTVNCKTIIKNQPSNSTVFKGTKAIFVSAVLDAGTTFQWKTKIGSAFQNLYTAGQYYGTTADSLTINPTDMSNKNQQFKCMLNYKGCKDSTKIVTLDVLCNPIVAKEPPNQNKYEGEKALFIVTSFDANSSFSWQFNVGTGFQNLSNSSRVNGVNNDTLSISNLILADNNQNYRCILSSEGCYDTSNSATLKVTCKPLINYQPKNKTAFVADNAILIVNSPEPNVSFIWQSDVGFGYQNLSNAGQYSGVNNDSLTIKNLSFSNDNQKFRCLLTLGACIETSNIATLFVTCKPIIVDQPKNKLAAIASSAYFNVTSTLPGITTYRWQTDIGLGFQNLSNAGQFKGVTKDTLIISNLTTANDNQTFRCLLNQGSCADTTLSASLTLKSGGIYKIRNNNLQLYPNPSNSMINFKITPELLFNNFKIIDQQGKTIISGILTETSMKINIENIAQGLYILQTEPFISRTLIIKE